MARSDSLTASSPTIRKGPTAHVPATALSTNAPPQLHPGWRVGLPLTYSSDRYGATAEVFETCADI